MQIQSLGVTATSKDAISVIQTLVAARKAARYWASDGRHPNISWCAHFPASAAAEERLYTVRRSPRIDAARQQSCIFSVRNSAIHRGGELKYRHWNAVVNHANHHVIIIYTRASTIKFCDSTASAANSARTTWHVAGVCLMTCSYGQLWIYHIYRCRCSVISYTHAAICRVVQRISNRQW